MRNSSVLVVWITSSAARDNMFSLLCSHMVRSVEVIVVWIVWMWNICAEDIWSSIQGARRARP